MVGCLASAQNYLCVSRVSAPSSVVKILALRSWWRACAASGAGLAVAEQDAGDVEDDGEVVGHDCAGPSSYASLRASGTVNHTHTRLIASNTAVTTNTKRMPTVAATVPPVSGPSVLPTKYADDTMP